MNAKFLLCALVIGSLAVSALASSKKEKAPKAKKVSKAQIKKVIEKITFESPQLKAAFPAVEECDQGVIALQKLYGAFGGYVDQPVCQCLPGYAGENCDEPADEGWPGCIHGTISLVKSHDAYGRKTHVAVCECHFNWQGADCNTTIPLPLEDIATCLPAQEGINCHRVYAATVEVHKAYLKRNGGGKVLKGKGGYPSVPVVQPPVLGYPVHLKKGGDKKKARKQRKAKKQEPTKKATTTKKVAN